MLKIKFCLTVLLLYNLTKSFAQIPDIEWQKCFGGSSYDDAYSIQQTLDSGYIILGSTWSSDEDVTFNHGNSDYWVVKLDSFANIQWQRSLGGSGLEEAYSISQTNDGGFILAGYSQSSDGDLTFNNGFEDCWIIKINSIGTIEWQKSYGGTTNESARSIKQTIDGGYIFAGSSRSNDGDVSGHHGTDDFDDGWVVKLNSDGVIEWQKSLGSLDNDVLSYITQISDGGYIVVGYTYTGDNWDYWILRLTPDGEIIWEQTLGGSDVDQATCVIESYDEGFIITGLTYSNDGVVTGHHGADYADYWVIKLNSTGSLIWQQCFGGTNSDESFSIIQTIDSAFIVTGVSGSDNGDVTGHHGGTSYGDYWIIKLDTIGNLLWQKSLGGTSSDHAYSINETLDSGFVIAGWSFSTDGDVSGHHGLSFNRDYWIVKLQQPCSLQSYFADADGDGFGDSITMILSCFDTVGFVLDNSDCNDLISEIHPGALDVCNNLDDNCNGLFDEDAIFLTWYIDADSDGYGNNSVDSISCFELSGFVFDNTDCNDVNNFINPGAVEICNSLDENCNLMIDEDLIFTTYYIDADGDNYGNAAIDSIWCSTIIGYIIDSTDCDDSDPDINPGISEILNEIDDNCNKLIDEGISIDETLLNTINIYPNPTDNILHIVYSGFSAATLEVINIDGQIIYTNYDLSSLVEIDVKEYAPGIYLLKIKTTAAEANLKFVKE